jgi:photosynthetic reaction center cytochrome c subunit
MYYMNTSLSVGCTHCHNSRYFPSWEQAAKYYARHMLEMTQYLSQNYAETLGNQEPSCMMCHYGNIIPPGAAKSVADVPRMLSSTPSEASTQ